MARITTISTTRLSILAALLLCLAGAVQGAESPHWNKATCGACHASSQPVSGNAALRTANAEQGCAGCHTGGGDAVACRHGSGLEVGAMVLPDNYVAALAGGRVVCTTCHDLTFQCKHPNPAYSYQNPGFLRDRVSHNSGDQCFECHDPSGYEKLNPHAGAVGTPPRETCLLCHESKPESPGVAVRQVTFNMRHDLNDTCRGCHTVAPHPKGMGFGKQADGWVHLVVPSADVLGRMRASEASTGVTLPLGPESGAIHCATCHDPHTFGGQPGSVGTSEPREHLLRQDNICQACHDK